MQLLGSCAWKIRKNCTLASTLLRRLQLLGDFNAAVSRKFRSYLCLNYISILTWYWMPAHRYTNTQAQPHSDGSKIHWQQCKANIASSLAPTRSLSLAHCISLLHQVPLVATLCGILFIYVMLALLRFCIYKIHTQHTEQTTQTHVSQGYR